VIEIVEIAAFAASPGASVEAQQHLAAQVMHELPCRSGNGTICEHVSSSRDHFGCSLGNQVGDYLGRLSSKL
jgi:hypothetical protein